MAFRAIQSRLLRVWDRIKMIVLRSVCVLVSAKALLHARTRYRSGGARETGFGDKKLEGAKRRKLSSLVAHLSNIIAPSCRVESLESKEAKMASDLAMSSLPAAEQESSTSALPTTSTAAAETPTTAQSLFDPLFEAKNSITHQSESPAQLHPLNSSLQSLYSASSSDGRLSRDEYRLLIAQLRHSVSQFAATTPALKSHQATSSSISTSDQLRRYISLLTETSTHTAALAHSIAPLKSADRQRSNAKADPSLSPSAAPFPQQLSVGSLASSSTAQPTTSWDAAVQTLAALCETLDGTAKALGLETFAEPSADAATAPSDSAATSDILTHTLTLGAKILVIDIELHIVGDSASHALRPKAKLKLSYATDSADSQNARDPRLGAVLERDVQLIADKLFGSASTSQSDRAIVAQALANWTNNLTELLVLDDLEVRASGAAPAGSRSKDLFAAMQELSEAVKRVSDAEASSSTSSAAALLERGHGLHKLHESKPFLEAVFAHDPTSKQDYTLSIAVQALDLPIADQASSDVISPTFPLSTAAQDVLTSAAASDPAQHLGSIPSAVDSEKAVPLHFVVRLNPPVVVSRSTASKLASICHLKHSPPHTNTAAPGTTSSGGAAWFEDVLAASWSQRPPQKARTTMRCTFTLAQTIESVRSVEEQGLVVDSLPLLTSASTISRLFAAIEVLRDEVKVTELMHSAVASSEGSGGGKEDLALDDLLATDTLSKIPVTLAFRTPHRAQQSLGLQLAFRVPAETGESVAFAATISPSNRALQTGWSISAVAKSSSSEASLDSSSSEAERIVTSLKDLASLEDVVIGLVDLASTSLGLNLQKPPAETAFDALGYEQQNVHAVYETIAPHFSNTRYKPWPLIPAFLSTLPSGSIGADLGCGNGKYLPLRSILASDNTQDSLLTIGVDRSSNLISLAQANFPGDSTAKHEVAVGDAIHSSLRTGVFDYAISIATIHHFSTYERRAAAVQELIRLVQPVAPGSPPDGGQSTDERIQGKGRGRFMIFVWALEQKDEGKRQFQSSNPEAPREKQEIQDPHHTKSKDRLVSYSGLTVSSGEVTDDQDVLVPWVLSTPAQKKKQGRKKDVETIEKGISALEVNPAPAAEGGEERPVYNRYYHVFRSGELEKLVSEAAASMPAVHRRALGAALEKVEVVQESGGWERGNWWGVWQVQWASQQ